MTTNNRTHILMLSIAGAILARVPCNAQTYSVTTVAGNGTPSYTGDGGPATGAQLNRPEAVVVDRLGNLFISDYFNCAIRKVSPAGVITTVVGQAPPACGYTGDGGQATKATINLSKGLAVDSVGNLYIADTGNNLIRKVALDGTITTVAGYKTDSYPGGGFSGDGAAAVNAKLNQPYGVAVDAANNIYIADTLNGRIRKVTNGIIGTFAGSGVCCDIAENGPPAGASMGPVAVAVDNSSAVYVADLSNLLVRRISGGIITTIAGTTNLFVSALGDGGAATSARLGAPSGLAVDSAGNVFIVDNAFDRLRLVSHGVINTIGGNGTTGFSGDGGAATAAEFNNPLGIALNANGGLFIADTNNNRIRYMLPSAAAGGLPVISAGGVVGATAFGAFSSIAPGSWLEIYGSNLAADTRGWGAADFTGSNAPTSLDGTKVTIAGLNAYVDYISPGQVNVQAPSNLGAGQQPVIVTTANGSSSAYAITVNGTQPGLLAPSSFSIGGKQYVAALLSDGTTFVLPPGSVPGLNSQRAKPGEAVTLYGIGFGAVTPNIPSGVIAPQTNALAATLQVFFGQTVAQVSYAGLAPGAVGLYQINLTVPNVAAGDAVPLAFTLNGVAGKQTLYVAVQN